MSARVTLKDYSNPAFKPYLRYKILRSVLRIVSSLAAILIVVAWGTFLLVPELLGDGRWVAVGVGFIVWFCSFGAYIYLKDFSKYGELRGNSTYLKSTVDGSRLDLSEAPRWVHPTEELLNTAEAKDAYIKSAEQKFRQDLNTLANHIDATTPVKGTAYLALKHTGSLKDTEFYKVITSAGSEVLIPHKDIDFYNHPHFVYVADPAGGYNVYTYHNGRLTFKESKPHLPTFYQEL